MSNVDPPSRSVCPLYQPTCTLYILCLDHSCIDRVEQDNMYCALGDFPFLHLGLCVIYGCSQPREWFIDFNHVCTVVLQYYCM